MLGQRAHLTGPRLGILASAARPDQPCSLAARTASCHPHAAFQASLRWSPRHMLFKVFVPTAPI